MNGLSLSSARSRFLKKLVRSSEGDGRESSALFHSLGVANIPSNPYRWTISFWTTASRGAVGHGTSLDRGEG